VSNLNVKAEKTFWGEPIKTPEQFIADICNRINTVYETAIEYEDEMEQFAYLYAALLGIKGRLDRVCKNE